MRCKKHVSDFSSSVGVCASCLRQRLEAVVEAQSQPKSLISDNPNPNCNHSQSLSSNQLHNRRLHHHHQQKQLAPPSQPPPLIFPRSVSPYISRRKSDQTTTATAAAVANNNKKPIIQRFYSTPQVGPTLQKKKSGGKFSLISKLFRSKSSVVSSASNSVVGSGEFARCRNRGMSPQNEWEELEEREKEAITRPSPGRVKASPARLANNVANFAFCLSPLVRASPASRFHWGVEPSFSGEFRVPATGKSNGGSCNNKSSNKDKPHLSEAASFCANRSKKLADFGRLNRNR